MHEAMVRRNENVKKTGQQSFALPQRGGKKEKTYKPVQILRRNLNTDMTQFKCQERKEILLDKR